MDGVEPVSELLERLAPVAVHLRARITARRLFDVAAELAPIARRAGSWLVVNGRPDVALAAGARAVQLGRAALGVRETRRMVAVCAGRRAAVGGPGAARGPGAAGELAIGASVHDAEEALRATRAGADYLVLGTIYATPSHPGVEGGGPEAVAAVRRRLASDHPPPILAIGGVRADRIEALLEAGAYGVVVGRAVWSAPDPALAADDLWRRLDTER